MMKVYVEIIVKDEKQKEYNLAVESGKFAEDLLALLHKHGFDAQMLETRGDEVI